MDTKNELLTELKNTRVEFARNYDITLEKINNLCKIIDFNPNNIKDINVALNNFEMIFTHLYIIIDDKY